MGKGKGKSKQGKSNPKNNKSGQAPSRPTAIALAVADALHAALPEAAGLSAAEVARMLERPPDPTLGDLAFPCFKLARSLRKAPIQIAADITAALGDLPKESGGIIAEVVATGPYVNARVDLGRAAALVLPAMARAEFPVPASDPPKPRVMVEYSQPNTHKAFHVGHMRNLCLGDALVRLLRAAGYPVIAANYFGDVGAHIAKCLWFLEHTGDLERLDEIEGQHRYLGEWLGVQYAAGHNLLARWEEATKAGDAEAATAHEAAKARITEILQQLEAREPTLTAIWDRTRKWSLDEFAEIYAWSGAHFDELFYESQVDEPGLKLVEEFLEKGVFAVSEGAVGIFNPEIKHMPFFMLRKRDGTSLYSTKDLALARLKFEQHDIDRSIYVVDARQADHFRHVFLTLAKMGFPQAERCLHVPYEMVELPDGPMGARKGNVILFRSLREQMRAAVIDGHLEVFRADWGDEQVDKTADAVALGAIRYGMLVRDVNQKIVFDMDAWTKIEGNTGPYLQYTYARARSILRKCAEVDKTLAVGLATPDGGPAADASAATATLTHPSERDVVLALAEFERTALHAADQLRPSILCNYLFSLCKSFNGFNANCRVKPQTGDLLQARLLLVTGFCEVLARGLELLGIPAPERM